MSFVNEQISNPSIPGIMTLFIYCFPSTGKFYKFSNRSKFVEQSKTNSLYDNAYSYCPFDAIPDSVCSGGNAFFRPLFTFIKKRMPKHAAAPR